MSAIAPALSFRRRILLAGGWTFSGHVAGQALRLASNLIMTRLLVPEMFGVMALANIVLVGLSLFSDLGLGQSIVQSRRGNEPGFLNTVWTVQILRGVLIWFFALAIGGGIYLLADAQLLPPDSAYADPILPWVIAALSFNAVIGGFASTRLATASRNLALGHITMIELISQVGALMLMVAWAFWSRSIWALVAGSLFATVIRVALSHAMLPGERNALHWDHDTFKEVFGFGKWIFLTSILGFLAANGDRLLLGGLTDPATLGLYAVAFFMVSALQDVLSKLMSNVAFPALSEVVRERHVQLKETYYKFRLPLDIVALLSTGLLMAAGHLLIELLYDSRYLAAGPMIEILCLTLFEVRYTLTAHCFMALGKPRLMLPNILVRLLAIFGGVPLAYQAYGMEGALWVSACAVLVALPVTLYQKIKLGLFDLRRELVVLPLVGLGFALGWMLVRSVESMRGTT